MSVEMKLYVRLDKKAYINFDSLSRRIAYQLLVYVSC